jgi:hypothetical protein
VDLAREGRERPLRLKDARGELDWHADRGELPALRLLDRDPLVEEIDLEA